MTFIDSKVSREHRYALGTDANSGQPYLAIPVSNRLADYDEYYLLTKAEFELFSKDEVAAAEFAAKCGRRETDMRLIGVPGPDRGTY